LVVTIFAVFLAGLLLFPLQTFKEMGESISYQAVLMSNVYFWKVNLKGYFAKDVVADMPLLHTWSLALEEQFYLGFPIFLALICRVARKYLAKIFFVLLLLSLVLCVYASYTHPSMAFFFLPFRAWELLLGAFLADALRRPVISAGWMDEFLGWAGILAILYAVFFFSSDTRFPGLATLLPCCGAALLIWSNSLKLTSIGKILAWRPIVFIGLISYSLYLFHWPMLVFSNFWASGPILLWRRILPLGASVLLASLSWRFIENPFRKRQALKSRSQVFIFAAVSFGGLFAAGLATQMNFVRPLLVPAAAQHYIDQRYEDQKFSRDISLEDALAEKFTELGVGNPRQKIDLLVWGDSHAMAILPIIDEMCKEYSIHGVAATHSATAPLVGYRSREKSCIPQSFEFNDEIVRFIKKNQIANVLIVARWKGYIQRDGVKTISAALLATEKALAQCGTRVWVMKRVPEYEFDVPKALGASSWFGSEVQRRSLNEWHSICQDDELCFAGLDPACATLLNPALFLIDEAKMCKISVDEVSLYRDQHHLSIRGAQMLRPLFEPIFLKHSGRLEPQ
jgi:peptidoglycan/LPS O-acetylase OafA/YrhL